MSTTQVPSEHVAPSVLEPLPGASNLLDDSAAGYCSGGVCHIPAPKTP
ncbi:hypothetical protein [Microbacterium sp. H83]|nr:hypothetical protein [Microbacterium sp. H83]